MNGLLDALFLFALVADSIAIALIVLLFRHGQRIRQQSWYLVVWSILASPFVLIASYIVMLAIYDLNCPSYSLRNIVLGIITAGVVIGGIVFSPVLFFGCILFWYFPRKYRFIPFLTAVCLVTVEICGYLCIKDITQHSDLQITVNDSLDTPLPHCDVEVIKESAWQSRELFHEKFITDENGCVKCRLPTDGDWLHVNVKDEANLKIHPEKINSVHIDSHETESNLSAEWMLGGFLHEKYEIIFHQTSGLLTIPVVLEGNTDNPELAYHKVWGKHFNVLQITDDTYSNIFTTESLRNEINTFKQRNDQSDPDCQLLLKSQQLYRNDQKLEDLWKILNMPSYKTKRLEQVKMPETIWKKELGLYLLKKRIDDPVLLDQALSLFVEGKYDPEILPILKKYSAGH